MNDEARDVLKEIVRTEGKEITGEPRRLQALLADRCGAYKLEINLLVSAADEGVPTALLRNSETSPLGATAERLARQLEEGRGFEYTRARWAVDSWADALGVDAGPMPGPDPAPAPSPVPPPPPPPTPNPGPIYDPLRTDGMTQPRPPVPPGPTPIGGANKNKLLIGGAVGLAVIVVGFLLITSDGKEKTSPTTVTVATTSPPTTTGPSTSASVVTTESRLIARVPDSFRSTCKTLAESDKRGDFRGIPAIFCEPTASVTAYYYQLPNPKVMNDEYNGLVSSNSLPKASCDPNGNSTFKAANIGASRKRGMSRS